MGTFLSRVNAPRIMKRTAGFADEPLPELAAGRALAGGRARADPVAPGIGQRKTMLFTCVFVNLIARAVAPSSTLLAWGPVSVLPLLRN